MREKEIKEKYPIGTKVSFSPGYDRKGKTFAIGVVDGYWRNEIEGDSDEDGYYTAISWSMTILVEGRTVVQNHCYIRDSAEVEIVDSDEAQR